MNEISYKKVIFVNENMLNNIDVISKYMTALLSENRIERDNSELYIDLLYNVLDSKELYTLLTVGLNSSFNILMLNNKLTGMRISYNDFVKENYFLKESSERILRENVLLANIQRGAEDEENNCLKEIENFKRYDTLNSTNLITKDKVKVKNGIIYVAVSDELMKYLTCLDEIDYNNTTSLNDLDTYINGLFIDILVIANQITMNYNTSTTHVELKSLFNSYLKMKLK